MTHIIPTPETHMFCVEALSLACDMQLPSNVRGIGVFSDYSTCQSACKYGERQYGAQALWSLFFQTPKKFKIWTSIFLKKIPECSLWFVPLVCKFLLRNSLYFILGKNNKNSNLWTKFQVKAHVPTFVHFVFFCWGCNTRYFIVEICNLIMYIVDYILVCFYLFFKTLKYQFHQNSKKKGSREPKHQTDFLVCNHTIMGAPLCTTKMQMAEHTINGNENIRLISSVSS
jgi:hypothetical protein